MVDVEDTATSTTPVSGALETVATFERYEDAQAFIDRLSDEGFSVEKFVVVGKDLKFVENITGRLNTFRATMYGAFAGLMFGALFGLLFGLIFAPSGMTLLEIVLYWLAVGAVVGAVFGIVSYALVGRFRSYTSDVGIRPATFELLGDPSIAAEARRRITRIS